MMPWMAVGRSGSVAILCMLLSAGCSQHSNSTVQATSGSSLDQFLPSTRPMEAGRVDDLVARAMAAPTMEERTAAVLGVSDSSTAQLGALLRGLAGAEEIVLDNLRNADTTGYKAVRVQNATTALR